MPYHTYRENGDVRAIALVVADRGYDAESIRRGLRIRGIRPWLAKRNTGHGSGLRRWRWVIERTFAWLNQFRRAFLPQLIDVNDNPTLFQALLPPELRVAELRESWLKTSVHADSLARLRTGNAHAITPAQVASLT